MSARDLTLVVLVALMWSFNALAAAKATQALSPFMVMIVRFLMVLAILWPALRLPPRDQWASVSIICILAGGLHFTLLFMALARSADISSPVIVMQSYTPMTVILAMVFLRERMSIFAVTIAFTGVICVGFDPLVLKQLDVMLLVLLAALSQAVGSIVMRNVRGLSAFGFQAWTAVLSMPFMILGTLIFDTGQMESLRQAELLHWISVAFSAIGASIIGHGLFFFLVQRNPVVDVMPYLTLMPLFGVVLGIGVWGDRPGWRVLLGGALVVSGVLSITLLARRKHPASSIEPST